MELEILRLLLQALPTITEIFTSLQAEKITRLKHEQAKEIANFSLNDDSVIPAEPGDYQQWRFEKEKSLQQQLAAYDRETQLKIAAHQRETALQLPEFNEILNNWPLKLFPSQLIGNYSNNQQVPLKIFLAPLQVQAAKFNEFSEYLPEFELNLAQSLGEFLNKSYSLNNQARPTEFLAGAWESQSYHREASVKALFAVLKSEPTLILESEIIGEYLNFRIAYWGLAQKNYSYQTIISKLDYRQIIYDSAKNRALKWQETAKKLLACGEPIEEVNQLGGDNAINLQLLQKEEKWKLHGIDTSELALSYKVNSKDFNHLYQFLITCYCLVAAWIADSYHLLHYNVPPLLPDLLSKFLQDISHQQLIQEVIQIIFSSYREIFNALEIEIPLLVPKLSLNLAQSLLSLSDKAWAKEQVYYSFQVWLRQRKLLQNEVIDSLKTTQEPLTIDEQKYLETLRDCLIKLDDEPGVIQVNNLILALANIQPKIKKEPVESSIVVVNNHHSDLQIENISRICNITGHSGKPSSIALSFDGHTIASSSDDNKIKLWNLFTGELLQTFNENTGRILSVATSRDGQILAASHRSNSRSYIKIWHLPTGQLLQTLNGHKKWVYALAISHNGQTLVSGGHKIKIWHLPTGELINSLDGHKKWVYALAISPDGQTLISSGSDKTIKIWHLPSGELICILTGHLDWIRTVAISPDGKILASGSDDNTIKIWDLATGKLLHTLTGHLDWVLTVAISPDGKTLISGSKDSTIKLWHLATGKLLHTLTEHKNCVYSLAVSPDGQTFISGSEDKTIKTWRVA